MHLSARTALHLLAAVVAGGVFVAVIADMTGGTSSTSSTNSSSHRSGDPTDAVFAGIACGGILRSDAWQSTFSEIEGYRESAAEQRYSNERAVENVVDNCVSAAGG